MGAALAAGPRDRWLDLAVLSVTDPKLSTVTQVRGMKSTRHTLGKALGRAQRRVHVHHNVEKGVYGLTAEYATRGFYHRLRNNDW